MRWKNQMSEIILPPGLTLPPQIKPTEVPPEAETPEEKATLLPEPAGYRLLCMVPDVSEKIAGTELDLLKPSDMVRSEEHSTTVLFVMRVGPDAFKDPAKFPNGAWCKTGDFVIVRAYAGTRFKIYGKEFRIINDDQVEAVVDDPRGITRA
jgi:co-chaperonin GroES (HSP10)